MVYPSYAEINIPAIMHNIEFFKKRVYPSKICAVVKANAYGHGFEAVAHCAVDAGASFLAVATPDEAFKLSLVCADTPVLILGLSIPNCNDTFMPAVRYTVCEAESVEKLESIGEKAGLSVKVHLKLDTGMNRIGVKSEKELFNLLEALKRSPHIELEGVYTHFAKADEADKSATEAQKSLFMQWLQKIREYGFEPEIIHSANSADAWNGGIIGNMVRLGISMYGECPSGETGDDTLLESALTWKTTISHIKTIEKGESVSYGGTWTAKRDSVIATLQIGYADGFRRAFGNKGYVLIGGKKAPIVGRVCMDQTMVDITFIENVKTGDTAVLLGSQENERITASQMADWDNTINYEILTGITARVARVYIKE